MRKHVKRHRLAKKKLKNKNLSTAKFFDAVAPPVHIRGWVFFVGQPVENRKVNTIVKKSYEAKNGKELIEDDF